MVNVSSLPYSQELSRAESTQFLILTPISLISVPILEYQMIFENRIFGAKRDENWEWRRLHNEELHSLYRSSDTVRVIKSRRLRWAGHVARVEEGRSVFKILTGKPTGNRALGRPWRRGEDNIRMDLK